ncbi:MAG: hypothetical protein JWN48_4319 [Myxococcaceae bacterium]|nr:hypothetical protein [Myxococcaceae bacterium]
MRFVGHAALLLVLAASSAAAQSVDAGVGADAAALPARRPGTTGGLSSADLPGLVKRRDGSYAYQGNGFDAVIATDGTVRMKDSFFRARLALRPVRLHDEVQPKNNALGNGTWSFTFFELKYDLMGYLESKLGNDPYRSERRWFLERTRALREELTLQSIADSTQHALRTIWSQAGLHFDERRRRTFALWDESGEDEPGQLCRAQVVAFVREHCPRDSGLGFSDAELRTLNATRKSRAAFAPYDP